MTKSMGSPTQDDRPTGHGVLQPLWPTTAVHMHRWMSSPAPTLLPNLRESRTLRSSQARHCFIHQEYRTAAAFSAAMLTAVYAPAADSAVAGQHVLERLGVT